MREREIIENLQKEITVPSIVQMKADWAFDQIKNGEKRSRVYQRKNRFRAVRAAVAAAALVCGTVTVGAAVYMNWSKGMDAQLKATNEQKLFLEEKQIATPQNTSATDAGITVTAQQSIVDSRFAHLSFKVEGYPLAEGQEPGFESIDVTVGGRNDFSWSGNFFNGITSDENGNPVFADGTPLGDDWAEVFVAEDGSMEFDLSLSAGENEGAFIDAPIHVEFKNLGTLKKAEYFPDLTGTWVLDFTLQGSDQIRRFTMNEALGDTGCYVIEAEISPISLQAKYRMPVETEEIEAVDENGNPITSTVYKEPPAFMGVRLKDGTLLPCLRNGGSEGFEDLDAGIYKVTFATDHVLNADEVDALLFMKPALTGEGPLTEENFYIVPLQ